MMTIKVDCVFFLKKKIGISNKIVMYVMNSYLMDVRERSGSVVECLIRDRRAGGSSLTGLAIVLTNSTFGLFYSNFLILTPNFFKSANRKVWSNSNFFW